jgi:hypothetical protein
MRRYLTEWNRARGDNIRHTAEKLERRGLRVTLLPHKTSILIERPALIDWANFKDILRNELQPRTGSIMVLSQTTGNAFICSNRGNRPGQFVRV